MREIADRRRDRERGLVVAHGLVEAAIVVVRGRRGCRARALRAAFAAEAEQRAPRRAGAGLLHLAAPMVDDADLGGG